MTNPPIEKPSASFTSGRAHAASKTLLLAALIVLNAVLALALMRLAPPNAARAGAEVQGRVSDYLIIPSRPLGVSQDVLYILDTDNARLAVAGFDPATGRIDIVAPLDLRRGR